MTSRWTPLVSLLVSVGIHAAVLGVHLAANGAESTWEEHSASVLSGDTFEVETLSDESLPERPLPAAAQRQPAQPLEPPHAEPAKPLPPREPSPPPAPAADAEPKPPPESATDAKPSQPEPAEPAPAPASEPRPAEPTPLPPAPGGTAPAVDPKPAAAVAVPPSAGTAAAPAIEPTASAPPTYGQVKLPPNVGLLAKGLTRAMPRAASGDLIWHRLPIGKAGSIVFSIELDEAGKLSGSPNVSDSEPKPPAYLKRLVQRSALMLKAGTYALSPQGVQAGSQRFELSAELRKVQALDDVFAEPEDLRQIGRLVEPTRLRPGKANFTYNSGRQVELTLRMLAN